MPQGTCAVDDCASLVIARGWCGKHYQRWKRYGDPLADVQPYRRLLPAGTQPDACTIDECGKAPVKAHGWCDTHYQRWRKWGDPLGVAPPRLPRPPADDTKLCRTCSQVKPRDEFSPRKDRGPYSVSSTCKACQSARAKAWNAANADRVLAWARANPERQRAANAKWRASPRGRAVLRTLERRRDPLKRRAKAGRRRARIMQTQVEPVDYQAIFQEHGGICGICGTPVNPDDYHMDHIVALANGGAHVEANLHPAHPLCNQRKGARPWPLARTVSPPTTAS